MTTPTTEQDAKTIELPSELQSAVGSWEAAASTLAEIENDDDYETAGEVLRDVATLERKIKDFFKPMIDSARSTLDAIRGGQAAQLGGLVAAKDKLRRAIGTYADKKAREEREAREAAARAAQEVADQLTIEAAEELEAQGDTAADALLSTPTPAPAPVSTPPAKAAPTKGVALRTTYSFEIVNEAAIPREYLSPNTKKIGQVVRAMEGKVSIPGVRVTKSTSVAARRR